MSGNPSACMSPVAEGPSEALSPAVTTTGGAFDDLGSAAVASLARAEALQKQRREEEAAAAQRAKDEHQAEILAKQERTRALLAEAQAQKAAETAAAAAAIEAERVANAKKKAEATLQFEEERKLKAMTPEQREAYLAKKEADRLAAIAAEEARLAKLAQEETDRLQAIKDEEERLHREAEEMARSILMELVVAIELAHAPPAPAAPVIAAAPDTPLQTVRSSTPSPSHAACSSMDPVSHVGSTSTTVTTAPQQPPTLLPKSSSSIREEEGERSAAPAPKDNKDTAPITTEPAPAAPAEATAPKQQKSGWFCCGSAVDEPEEVPPQSRPIKA